MKLPVEFVAGVSAGLLSVALFGCNKSAPAKVDPKVDAKQAAAHGDGHGHAHPSEPGMKLSKIDPGASVSFGNLQDGQTVKGPVKDGKVLVDVQMNASKVRIVPAGKQEDFTGHHHLVIDGAPVPEGKAVPADDTHIHYGKGQTKVQLPLSPGAHTLTMQLADGYHLSYGPKYSATVKLTVAPAE